MRGQEGHTSARRFWRRFCAHFWGGARVRSSYLTCPAVLYREEDQDDNWNEEKESDEVGCLQDRRSLTGRSNEDHRLAQREREEE